MFTKLEQCNTNIKIKCNLKRAWFNLSHRFILTIFIKVEYNNNTHNLSCIDGLFCIDFRFCVINRYYLICHVTLASFSLFVHNDRQYISVCNKIYYNMKSN